jgi:hypothetical protein
VLAGQVKPAGPYPLRDATETDADELLARAGFAADEIAKLRADGAVA